ADESSPPKLEGELSFRMLRHLGFIHHAEQVRGSAFSIVLNPILAPGAQPHLRCLSATDLAGLRRPVRTVLVLHHRTFPWPFDFGIVRQNDPLGRWSPGPSCLIVFSRFFL